MPSGSDRADAERHTYGALMGWTSVPLGGRIQLTLQTVERPDLLRRQAIDELHLVMSEQQALQLANQLYAMTGAEPPERRRRGRLRRLLGR